MSIGWGFVDIVAAGIPAYFLYALLLQFLNLKRNRFRDLGISQLLIDPIAKTDMSEVVKAKLPQIINLPLYPIILTLILGFFSYTTIDVFVDRLTILDYLDRIGLPAPRDEYVIKKVYQKNQDFVISSEFDTLPIKIMIGQFENDGVCKQSSSTKENICVEIYRYQRRFLQLSERYFNTGCAAIRSGVRFSREMFVYSLIAFFLFLSRFIHPFKAESQQNNDIHWYQWLATRIGSLFGLIFSLVFIVTFIFIWNQFNHLYYSLIIHTYHLIPYVD